MIAVSQPYAFSCSPAVAPGLSEQVIVYNSSLECVHSDNAAAFYPPF